MSRYHLLAQLSDQDDIDEWFRKLPANAQLAQAWQIVDEEGSDMPVLLFVSEPAPTPIPSAIGEGVSFATPEPVNPGWHVGQRVKAVGGLPQLVGLEGEVRAFFPSEESDDDDQIGRNGIVAKMDGRPFPQLVVKYDGYRRRIRYSGAEDLLKLQPA